MAKPVYMIVACSENRVIGRDGGLPWDLPEDSAYYATMTEGGIVIEGRKVYEELGRAMPNRKTIVLTRNPERRFPDAETASSLGAALEMAQHSAHPGPIWIAGGEQVYEEAMAVADKLFLTLVHDTYVGDTYFPEWDPPFSTILSKRTSSHKGVGFTFLVLEGSKPDGNE